MILSNIGDVCKFFKKDGYLYLLLLNYRLKFFEVFYEAYPQLLINLMLMMRLNMYKEWLYVGRFGGAF